MADSDLERIHAEIAQLERAIDQHKHAHQHSAYSSTRGSTYSRAAPARGHGRGGRGRGRGRGAAPGYKNATWVAGAATSAGTATATGTDSAGPPAPSRSAAATPTPIQTPTATATEPPPEPRQVTIDGVVFVADPRGNKLVRKPTGSDPSPAPATATVTATATTDDPAAAGGAPLTPRRLSHLGTTYIRTKTGNLVSLAFARKQKELVDRRRAAAALDSANADKRARLDRLVGVVQSVQAARTATATGGRGGRRGRRGYGQGAAARRPPRPKSDKLCRFFQRTGQCSRAHTCPYVHDSTKIAICPLFLRSACPRTAATCPLSHHPNAHRSPHCVHFPNCSRGSACPYAHVTVSSDAPPCRDFVEVGWCAAGEECEKRHVRECWRFAETGKCDLVGCREPHVLRRTHTASEEEEGEDQEESDEFQDAVDELIEDAVERNEADRVFDAGNGTTKATTTTARQKMKRSRRDSDAPDLVGISGAAGRQLKRLKDRSDAESENKSRTKRVFAGQDDFVTLEMPLSSDDDDDDEEEEEASSVDSEDLVDQEDEDEDEDDEVADDEGQPGTAVEMNTEAAAAPLPATGAPPRQRATDVLDQDALDYGDDDE